jgi:DNA-binding FadR family transcriptional regulator
MPSERRLSEELGASRHAVREALKRLQEAGLVAISQGGPTRVLDWRRHGGLDLILDGDVPAELHAARATMEMRACIGADAARLCAARATAEQRARLLARVEQIAAVDHPSARARARGRGSDPGAGPRDRRGRWRARPRRRPRPPRPLDPGRLRTMAEVLYYAIRSS